ncbi:MAG: ABC transporter ATP-binding protein [Rickettsiaceae bacterium]
MIESEYIIDASHLTKIFGTKKVVDDFSIQVPRGKIFGFLGPNGSGKTTTIRMICGLLTADEGKGTCLGYDINTQSELIRQHVGYMTQKFSYWEDLTIQENLEFVVNMFGLDRPKERVQKALKDLGLQQRQKQLAGNLSGGWKQRLALAACIIHEPEVLLLDEPTAGVDPKARREFWDEIHRLVADGLTVLVSTHYMDEAERCHEIIYIAEGKLIVRGTVANVIEHAGLITWVVRGKNLVDLQKKLESHPAITSIAPFGDSLHISGIDINALDKAILPYRNDHNYKWTTSVPSMEDAFIHYMARLDSGREL